MSSGFEICNYHTSHVQWLPEKTMKRNCNSLWGSLAAKRWCLAEQLCQTIIFSFLSWLFLHYCFFKHTMRTGTEDTGGSWQFEWINPTKMLLSSVKKLLFRDIPVSKPLAQFSMYSPYAVKQVLFQRRFFQKLSHLIFWVQISQNMNLHWEILQFLYLSFKKVLDEITLPVQVISQT